MTDVTQHYYVGGVTWEDNRSTQAISNMLSPEWVNGTAIGTQPDRAPRTPPIPGSITNNLAPVAAGRPALPAHRVE